MASEGTPPKRPGSNRFTRWSAQTPPRGQTRRMAFRLLGLPILAVAAVYLFNGLKDYVELPQCDSERAKQTLAQVFKELNLEPVRYEPIKTISSSKSEVVCNAVLPLPDGATVVADYTLYWQGNNVNIKYSIHREAAKNSALTPPRAPPARSYDLAGTR